MSAGPLREQAPRLLTLDGIRGLAVMGILVMNMAAFAMPFAAYTNPVAWGRADAPDLAAWFAEFVLIDGKLRALFTALFGASLLLVIERAEAAGANGVALHLRRMAWLALIGAAHGLLLWAGDILFLYAAVGSIAWLLRRKDATELLVLAVLLLGASALAQLLLASGGASFLPDRAADAAEADAYRSGYAAIVAFRGPRWWPSTADQLVGFGPETLGYMLGGMAGLRSGFLAGDWSSRSYRRVAGWGYLAGLPALALLGGWVMVRRFDGNALYLAEEGLGALLRPVVAAAHAAFAMLWFRRSQGPVVRAVAAAGRMALTNYLGTSVVVTTLFYGYGVGFYGTLGRAGQLALALLLMPLMPIASRWWLGRFRYGPVEWLWRCLTRGQLLPNRLLRSTLNVG